MEPYGSGVVAAQEKQRLGALRRYGILDTPPEAAFDRLTSLAARLLHVPIAQVTFVDEHRQWFKSSCGAPTGETPRALSFCAHAIQADGVMNVPDATKDSRFATNALVTGAPHIRAYAGAPIKSVDGFKLGTVCAIDTVQRDFTSDELGILRDLAAMAADELELRLAIEERSRAATELHESLEKLKKTEAQRDDLTHMIIHDLRSPLTCIKGFIDALAKMASAKLDEDETKCVVEAQSGAARLNEMISTLLDVARLESGEMPLQLQPHNVALIALQVARRFEPILNGRRLECDVPPLLLHRCDGDLIRRVTENLVSNAIKFTKADGAIRLRVQSEASQITVCVEDDGCGIPPDKQELIFEKFGQVNGNHDGHSSGVGLTFCKFAVKAHGGEIGVRSEAGLGSTFWFTLPLQNVPPNVSAPPRFSPHVRGARSVAQTAAQSTSAAAPRGDCARPAFPHRLRACLSEL